MEEFIQEFKEESTSIIERVQQALLSLDLKADNSSVIEEIFRGVHTLKGSSRMFGFEEIERLTHELENKYDKIREKELKLDKSVVDLSLKVMDQTLEILNGNNNENDTSKIIEEIENIQQSDDSKTTNCYQIFFHPEQNIYERGVNPSAVFEELDSLGETMVFTTYGTKSLEEMEEDKVFDAAFEIFIASTEEEDNILDVFLFMEDNEFTMYKLEPGKESIDDILIRPKSLFKNKYNSNEEQELQRACVVKEFCELSSNKKQEESGTEVEPENTTQKTSSSAQGGSSSLNYINVKLERLDEMMNLVSELVTVKAKLSYQANISENTTLSTCVDHLDKLTNKFRDIAFSMRLVPLQVLSLKFQRLIRDLGTSLQKEIKLISQGLDTEFDKSIIHEIEGPLIHILRNAVDHGLETPEDREKLGKSPEGLIKISAFSEGTNVYIQIQDDGKGLDLEKIKQSAISKGLIAANAKLTEQEITNLIFMPGFSTQQEATTVSGRGVGMDVVNSKLKELRGAMTITTEKGLGTTFMLRLPLSLSILDVLHVKVGNVNYVIPQSEIQQCFSERLNKDVIKRNGYNFKYKNELVPHLQLDHIFGEKNIDNDEPSIILLDKNDELMTIEVHKIVGEDQLVIKPVDEALKSLPYLSGVSVLGNGELAFLLDSFRLKNSLSESRSYENPSGK